MVLAATLAAVPLTTTVGVRVDEHSLRFRLLAIQVSYDHPTFDVVV